MEHHDATDHTEHTDHAFDDGHGLAGAADAHDPLHLFDPHAFDTHVLDPHGFDPAHLALPLALPEPAGHEDHIIDGLTQAQIQEIVAHDPHVSGHLELGTYEHQTHASSCLPTSVAMVAQQLGVPVHESDVLSTAHQMFPQDGDIESKGMPDLRQGADLLKHYGIDAKVENGSMAELEQLLHSGAHVILGVDGDETYHVDYVASGDHATAHAAVLGNAPDPDGVNTISDAHGNPIQVDGAPSHALVVTAIDHQLGVAILNDPANPSHLGGYAVKLEVLEAAWKDSGHQMIVVDQGLPTASHALANPFQLSDPNGPFQADALSSFHLDTDHAAQIHLDPIHVDPISVSPDLSHAADFILLPIVLAGLAGGAAAATWYGYRSLTGESDEAPVAPMEDPFAETTLGDDGIGSVPSSDVEIVDTVDAGEMGEGVSTADTVDAVDAGEA
jgi:hypothetical protein